MGKTTKRAAVGRLGGIGDDLVASSVFPLLKKQGYSVDVISNEPFHVVFENNPYIDRLILLRREDLPGACDLEWQMWWVRRSHEYDKLVHLSHSLETTLALLPSQTPFWWNPTARRKMCDVSYLERTHDIADVPHIFNPGPRFYPTEDEYTQAIETKEKIGDRVIAWVISGSRIDKIYPQATMAISRLIRETGLPVIMFGASAVDYEMAKVVQNFVQLDLGSMRGLHLAGGDPALKNWPIRRSLSQLQTCDLVIGPDTGLMWSVAMESMPKVMLASHAGATAITKHWRHTVTLSADPKRVPCFPCHRLHSDQSTCVPNENNSGAACISDIRVGDLVDVAKHALDLD